MLGRMTQIRALIDRELTIVNAVSLTSALVIAELFYKFHSFTLEAAAFVATWYGFRVVGTLITGKR